MKPTIRTSPLTWSWTTAGMSPSSFEKSIAFRVQSSGFQVPGSGFRVPSSRFRFRVPYKKNPRHVLPAGLLRCWFRVLLVPNPSTHTPAGRPRGRGDEGARDGTEPCDVEITSNEHRFQFADRRSHDGALRAQSR